MLLHEVFADDLLEAGLKDKLSRAAAAGIIGAGIGGLYGVDSYANIIQAGSVMHQPYNDPTKSKKVTPGADVNSELPLELHNQNAVTRNQRIKNFQDVFLPIVNDVNKTIKNERAQLLTILNPRHTITRDDKIFVELLAESYNINLQKSNGSNKTIQETARELLYRVDIIPESLVIAQAALESGWATSELSRQGLNFFGQRATPRHSVWQRIKHTDGFDYRQFGNIEHGIRSYIRNLNTNKLYDDFRTARAALHKQKNITSDGVAEELSKYLHAYSSSPEYSNELKKIMYMLRTVK